MRNAQYIDEVDYGGSRWMETREAPDPPAQWFVDAGEVTLFRAKNKEHAEQIVEVLRIRRPDIAPVVRCYSPTKEEYEEDCQRTRDAKRWRSSSGGPANPWPNKGSLSLIPAKHFRAKKPDNGNAFAKALYEALKK